ncbi:hypothetical protein O3G_MSEX002145 [Manduca sexta]|nr:hypothetical protein O3G_MSEX002145 [Manduca sexta]
MQGVHCSITLHFRCCPTYPDKPPNLAIHKMHGLSTENGARLLSDLESLANQLCGEVMIFQLAQHAQQFLHDHNKPTLSFYDEMLKEKNEMEKLKQHDLQAKEEEERQKIKDEIQRRQNILKGAGRQRTHRSSISQDHDSLDGQGDAPELVYYADDKTSPIKKISRSRTGEIPCTCNIKSVQVLRVTQRNNKKVYIGSCLGHSSTGATTYLAIDDDTGERLIAKKWLIPPVCDFQSRNKQITSLQQEFKSTYRLVHPTLVPYVAMETAKEVVKRTPKQCIYIFRPFILGISLRNLKRKFNGFGGKHEALKLLRNVANGVLSALSELHSTGVFHRDIRGENVYLDDCGGVKLVGVALDSRLAEMLDCDDYCDRQTAAQDIYASGQLFLSIVSEERTCLDLPEELPVIAKDFLSRCLTEDEHSQWSAKQLLNHIFLVDVPPKQPSKKIKEDSGSGSEDEDAVNKIHQHVNPPTNGHSRLNAEFEVLAWLGKGAFGDVLKVKNKLDGGFYAIKRVELNPESVQLNKKITREVKLLSRLNHENVVRYYNAWIESSTEATTEESVVAKSPTKRPGESLACVVAKLGQEVKVEWSMSEGPVQKTNTSSDSEEDDDDDEPDPWFNIMSPEDESSECIQFEKNSNESHTIPSEDVIDAPLPQSEKLKQVLYIQMEFCEKHTLRHAIDNGLYQEHFRAWRLFREIVEGLAHVHQRGMIHRDLKPVNIFLDSNDHVKIGDFGLATKAFSGLLLDDKTKNQEEVGGSLTGQVGTALYVAPELLQRTSKVIYNQKVDIYSLGIILFEMFHPPLETGMERMMILTNLRTKDITVPREFEVEDNAKQIHVIRWLLNHEASLRPTCAELLSSEHVPRPVPEGALSGLLSHALSDRGARGYQRLVAACLDQRLSPAEDYTYHNGMKVKPGETLAAVKDAVIKVFRSHGASEFSPPLLMPRAKAWDQHPNAVKIMTASGYVCHLPHDLRLPFARHTAYSGIKSMRRYVVDRVYREKHVQGFHPREMIECAFDIVTAKTDYSYSLWPDAELLVVASRAATESSLKVSIQLNHTELVRILLQSCGVPLDKHADIYPVLVDVSFGRITSLQVQTHLTSLCITKRDVSNLLRLMEADVPVYEVRELVTPVVKQAKWSKTVAQAIHELETVYRNAKALGCECPMTVAPFLAYNATQHSGVFWQMAMARHADHKPSAKHRAGDLIAAGGRYDALVEEFWKVARTERDDNSDMNTSSVGFSMSLERMAAILKKMEGELPAPVKSVEMPVIHVCMWGAAGSGKDGQAAVRRAALARALWGAALAACTAPAAHDLDRRAVLALHDAHTARIQLWDGDRMREHKVPYIEVLDFIKQKLVPESARSNDTNTAPNRSISWSDTEKYSGPITSVTFITANDRMTKNSKRQCENQISNQLSSILCGLGVQGVRVRVGGAGAGVRGGVRARAGRAARRAARPHRPAARVQSRRRAISKTSKHFRRSVQRTN